MWKWLKVPKGAALLAFLLPWWTVSCSNQKMAEATGLGLATGNIERLSMPIANSSQGPLNWWLIISVFVIIFGFCNTLRNNSSHVKTVLTTSTSSIVLVLIGTHRYSKDSIIAEAARQGQTDGTGQAADVLIQVDWQLGYWITLVSLAASAFLAWQIMREDTS